MIRVYRTREHIPYCVYKDGWTYVHAVSTVRNPRFVESLMPKLDWVDKDGDRKSVTYLETVATYPDGAKWWEEL